jgi:hypothetical protein
MTTTVTTTPTYPVPNREAKVTFSGAPGGATWLRAWCTVAPTGSKEYGELKAATTSNRVVVYEGDGSSQPWRWTPTVGGKYRIVAQWYTRGSSYGGGYAGDPNADPTETPVGGADTVYIYVGERLHQQLGTGGDIANLGVWAWNATIRATTADQHGETTPVVSYDSPSPKALTAINSSDVRANAASLANVAASTALGTIATIVSDMYTKIAAHIIRTSGSTHNAADADNTLKPEIASSPSVATLAESVNALLTCLRRHMLNDKAGEGTGSAAYHKLGGVNKADYVNLPIVKSVSGIEDAYPALAEVWRAYEAHRVSLSVHGAADTTNTLTALPALLAVHEAFFAQLAATSPSTPPAGQSAVTELVAHGFQEG